VSVGVGAAGAGAGAGASAGAGAGAGADVGAGALVLADQGQRLPLLNDVVWRCASAPSSNATAAAARWLEFLLRNRMADSSRQLRIRCGKAKNQVKLSRQGCTAVDLNKSDHTHTHVYK
jgi:hypothetical protein